VASILLPSPRRFSPDVVPGGFVCHAHGDRDAGQRRHHSVLSSSGFASLRALLTPPTMPNAIPADKTTKSTPSRFSFRTTSLLPRHGSLVFPILGRPPTVGNVCVDLK
jgi:hypothetical protein